MTYIESVTLEVPDPAAAEAFYTAAFGLGDKVRLRASQAPTTGFRGFMLSLVVRHNHHMGSPQFTTAPNHASHAIYDSSGGKVQ